MLESPSLHFHVKQSNRDSIQQTRSLLTWKRWMLGGGYLVLKEKMDAWRKLLVLELTGLVLYPATQ